MINGGEYHAKYKHGGKTIIVDIAKLPSYAYPDGVYEVMAMTEHGGKELSMLRTPKLDEAIEAYNKMLADFPADEQRDTDAPPPLTGKYAKLRDDLKKALEIGKEAAAKVEDTGTCNLDAASLSLPRWNTEKVKQAAKEAGTGCFRWNLYGQQRFVFSTPRTGQARKNEEAAEAMTAVLKGMGYDAMNYCQMD